MLKPGPCAPCSRRAEGLALYEHARAIAGEIGFAPGHGSYGGGSDGNFTGALGVPTFDGLGVCGDGAHTHEEHLLVSSLVPRARLLAGLFERLGRSAGVNRRSLTRAPEFGSIRPQQKPAATTHEHFLRRP